MKEFFMAQGGNLTLGLGQGSHDASLNLNWTLPGSQGTPPRTFRFKVIVNSRRIVFLKQVVIVHAIQSRRPRKCHTLVTAIRAIIRVIITRAVLSHPFLFSPTLRPPPDPLGNSKHRMPASQAGHGLNQSMRYS